MWSSLVAVAGPVGRPTGGPASGVEGLAHAAAQICRSVDLRWVEREVADIRPNMTRAHVTWMRLPASRRSAWPSSRLLLPARALPALPTVSRRPSCRLAVIAPQPSAAKAPEADRSTPANGWRLSPVILRTSGSHRTSRLGLSAASRPASSTSFSGVGIALRRDGDCTTVVAYRCGLLHTVVVARRC